MRRPIFVSSGWLSRSRIRPSCLGHNITYRPTNMSVSLRRSCGTGAGCSGFACGAVCAPTRVGIPLR
ncbi:hypothetical protein PGTUg99_032790 [Puccinia graminis f. sp. tritici]|uniref:Uncharacterized protein n=1 Tax=Puccinia graminis f. sp. tritici TaxID=56615 RepID=A0A5B0P2N8_PUCGR|nr:hypothetical protein PGTUg99_032790 [Puccinia graminis f. sp. tritici]